ncbi:MAG TPA: hypothetical protein VFH25_04660 [Nitrososphaeraceae archaeon]|nr:hypothetical protein [Nitrososphaeraceae archaeon]
MTEWVSAHNETRNLIGYFGASTGAAAALVAAAQRTDRKITCCCGSSICRTGLIADIP